ncbi:hypothetical protein JF544_10420 [Halobacillus kuroshimensis]|uniref:Uncharacterized protein n=1 Tax=Halobacillus kuroshimensis TaxID=302481 RepID=A0ABS3DWG1_9BACI|nr:hypothetical protein [Halobacillus kuroshimensis]
MREGRFELSFADSKELHLRRNCRSRGNDNGPKQTLMTADYKKIKKITLYPATVQVLEKHWTCLQTESRLRLMT